MGGGPRLLYSEKRTPGTGSARLCKNAQVEKAEYMPAKLDFIRSYVPVPETDPEAVKAAAELINGAERPLVLVGQGVELGNAQQELRAFIERQICPPDVRCWDCRLCRPSILEQRYAGNAR